MIATGLLPNLMPWYLQVAAIVTVASVLPWLFRVDAPNVRYVYWRAIAVLCLTLPWIQPYRPSQPLIASTAADATIAPTAVGAVARTVPQINWETFLLCVLAIGIVVRLGRLSTGLIRLRHMRRRATVHSVTPADADAQKTLGTHAIICYARQIEQPLTFGVFKPIVMLPQTLVTQSREIQEAVLGHELLHVKRRDWAWLIVEELVVCVFWFHPASWWVTSQIQRAREEVVDELAIQLTGRRKAYVEALLTFADTTSVVRTAAFARRRHLFRRIALVSKESVMSSRRIVATCAAMALIVVTGSWYAVSAFPLQVKAPSSAVTSQLEPGPLERKAHAVTPENPIPRRVHYEETVLPDGIRDQRAVVDVRITLDDVGRIAEARVLDIYRPSGFKRDSGETRQTRDALVEAALASVRQWRYDAPFEAPLAFTVQVRIGTGAPVMEFKPRSENGALRVGGDIKPPRKIKDVPAVYPPIARQAGVAGVVILEIKIGTDGFVEDGRVLKSIPLLDEAALDAVKQWQFEPTLMNGQPMPVIMTVTINFYQQ
jgi:TonB family protein